ncbi:MAG: restriction endonuclease [Rhodanobacter sp.]
MPIPDYQTLMLPLLRFAADGKDRSFREAIEALAAEFSLSNDERSELLASGSQPLFDNRVGWAKTYLKQAGLLASPKRGIFHITEPGIALLAKSPASVGLHTLVQYEAFREFRSRRRDAGSDADDASVETTEDAAITATPEDQLASAYQRLRQRLEVELLEQVKSSSPAFFERLVIDLLVTMGYGGSRRDAGRAIGKSGDGGIDGIIKEDKLGLDVIYIQAKRWEGTVGRPEIQKFAGALQGHRANKGVFITTSSYTREAKEYTGMINTKIILIDGIELTGQMIDHNVGISSVGLYEVKKIDTDYFEGE